MNERHRKRRLSLHPLDSMDCCCYHALVQKDAKTTNRGRGRCLLLPAPRALTALRALPMLLVLGALAVASSHAVHAQASCPVRYTVDPVVVRQEAAVFGEAEVARFCRQLPARRGPVRYEAFISALVDLVRPSLQAGHADRVSAFLQALSDKKAVVGERSPGRGNAGASFVARFALDEAARGEYVLVSAPAGTPAAPLVATDTVRRPFAISSEGDPSEMVVVVRGTRGREPRKNTPERVTVIDAKEIERKAPRTTEEIFLGVPGVDVVRQGGGFTSSVSNVVLRGLGGQARGRTLVVRGWHGHERPLQLRRALGRHSRPRDRAGRDPARGGRPASTVPAPWGA